MGRLERGEYACEGVSLAIELPIYQTRLHIFLAAMSSSRSVVVTQFVGLSVTNEFFLSPKRFNGVSRKFKGCLKFEGCFMEVLRMCQGSYECVYRKFQVKFKAF